MLYLMLSSAYLKKSVPVNKKDRKVSFHDRADTSGFWQ